MEAVGDIQAKSAPAIRGFGAGSPPRAWGQRPLPAAFSLPSTVHPDASQSAIIMSLRPAGLEPATPGLGNRCSTIASDEKTTTYENADPVLTDLLTAVEGESPELAELIRTWPTLPEAIRTSILVIAKVVTSGADEI